MLGIGLTFLKKILNPHYYVVPNIDNYVVSNVDNYVVPNIDND